MTENKHVSDETVEDSAARLDAEADTDSTRSRPRAPTDEHDTPGADEPETDEEPKWSARQGKT